MQHTPSALCGIVLAAGAGTRIGGPKALLSTPDGTPWLTLAVGVLAAAGCDHVVVVLGAAPDAPVAEAAESVSVALTVVLAEDWSDGMSASLRAGLAAATGDAALVTLVDLPGMPAAVARRVATGATRDSLAQAVFGTRPGHPVLIGADHWGAVAASLEGDRGARPYLMANGVTEVECGDLWTGDDIDQR